MVSEVQMPLAPCGHAPLRSLAEGGGLVISKYQRRLGSGAWKKSLVKDVFFAYKFSEHFKLSRLLLIL